MQVEIFKTNISNNAEASRISKSLLLYFPNYQVHFDLYDSDRILRVQTKELDIDAIILQVKELGFDCKLVD